MNFQPRPPADDRVPAGRSGGDVNGNVPDLAVLQATDALLDRLGRRQPSPDDLDDPLVAALALFAGEIDLSEAPVSRTRQAWDDYNGSLPGAQRHDQGLGGDSFGFFAPARREVVPASYVDLDLVGSLPVEGTWAEYARADHTSADHTSADHTRTDDLPADGRRVDHARAARISAEDGRRGPVAGPVVPPPAVTPHFTPPAADEPAPRASRALRLRVVPTAAAAAAGLLLSMGAAAAVTGGESVNPANVVKYVLGHGYDDPASRYAPGPNDSIDGPAGGIGPATVARRSTSADRSGVSQVPGGGVDSDHSSLSPKGDKTSASTDTTAPPQWFLPGDPSSTDPASGSSTDSGTTATSGDTGASTSDTSTATSSSRPPAHPAPPGHPVPPGHPKPTVSPTSNPLDTTPPPDSTPPSSTDATTPPPPGGINPPPKGGPGGRPGGGPRPGPRPATAVGGPTAPA